MEHCFKAMEGALRMRIAKGLSFVGVIAMTLAIINGFVNGDFMTDGGEILGNPWGIVSLVDLYVGFVLFSMWIVFREQSVLAMTVWVVLMMTLGFLTASVYIFVKLYESRGDWITFFLGANADRLIQERGGRNGKGT